MLSCECGDNINLLYKEGPHDPVGSRGKPSGLHMDLRLYVDIHENDARQTSGRRLTVFSSGGAIVKMRGSLANR
jgi:hypothetical protein